MTDSKIKGVSEQRAKERKDKMAKISFEFQIHFLNLLSFQLTIRVYQIPEKQTVTMSHKEKKKTISHLESKSSFFNEFFYYRFSPSENAFPTTSPSST